MSVYRRYSSIPSRRTSHTFRLKVQIIYECRRITWTVASLPLELIENCCKSRVVCIHLAVTSLNFYFSINNIHWTISDDKHRQMLPRREHHAPNALTACTITVTIWHNLLLTLADASCGFFSCCLFHRVLARLPETFQGTTTSL